MSEHSYGSVSCGGDQAPAPQAVLAVALEAYVSVTADGRVSAWNPAAEETFGFTREQACGRRIDELIIPAEFREAHRRGLARLASGGPSKVLGQRLQLRACHRDGHEFPIEMTLTATDGPTGRLFHAFARDVTLAHRASRFAAAEAAVSAGLARATGSHDAARQVVEALGVTMGWPVVELWLGDDVRQMLTCAGRWTASRRLEAEFGIAELEFGVGLPGAVCRDGRPVWVSDLAVDDGYVRTRAAARLGLHVAVGVPISSGGQVLGALCVFGDRVEDPQDLLMSVLTGLAAQVGQFMERRRAEELDVELARTKSEFVALVTHELRNPLAVIAYAVSAFEEELSELSVAQMRQYLHTISRNTERLSAMADDLLDLAWLESGNLAIRHEQADLVDVLRQAIGAITAAASGKALTVHLDVPASLPLLGDASRLRQVADNLLSNAVKYTPRGGTIRVSAHVDGEKITWTVSDTGIGIPEAERPRLFRRFYRASTALENGIPGTGLGLVIARTIVERHHGTISLVDNRDTGTTFMICLPVKPVA